MTSWVSVVTGTEVILYLRNLCSKWNGFIYGCLQNRNGTRRQAIKEGPSVSRTRKQDVASLTDAGVIVFVNNT